jgi:hypothetical protein
LVGPSKCRSMARSLTWLSRKMRRNELDRIYTIYMIKHIKRVKFDTVECVFLSCKSCQFIFRMIEVIELRFPFKVWLSATP